MRSILGGTAALALCCTAACGGEAVTPREDAQGADREVDQPAVGMPPASTAQPEQAQPPTSTSPPLPQPTPAAAPVPFTPATPEDQRSAACVQLPPVPALAPVLSYEEGCAVSAFRPGPDPMSASGGEDARARLVGRWRLCGESQYYGGAPHAGLEFGSNGRNQLLRLSGDRLLPISGGPRGVYYLLGSGQFMQRGELVFGTYSVRARFDLTNSVLELSDLDNTSEQSEPPLQYVRVEADEDSAARNVFSTSSASCSMVGVWDTAVSSGRGAAAFAFNERGEWLGGAWQSDLCSGSSMYGTYNLETRGGNAMDNFDLPATTELEIVTNVGAGSCAFWFNAGYEPAFSADCNRVQLRNTFDNCTGGRGYLDDPANELIRRVP